jgi:predicted transcriptional regulator
MTQSTTLTVRLTSDVKDQLGRLAEGTNRTKSFLASEAIEAYVKQQLEIVEGIERGLADMKAGRLVSHDEATQRIRALIDRAAKK